MKKCVIWGATGQAMMLRPILTAEGYEIVALFDNNVGLAPPFPGIPLHFGWSGFEFFRRGNSGDLAFCVAIGGDGKARANIGAKLEAAGLTPVTVVHETAFVARTALLAPGCQVMPMAAICEYAEIGPYSIVNTNATIDHETVAGRGVHIMPGATVTGCVRIGDFVTVGSNATVLPRISIADGAFIGAGAVVTRDVPAEAIVKGVPARGSHT